MTEGHASLPTAPLEGEGPAVACPSCTSKVRLGGLGTGLCSGCGTSLLDEGGRLFAVTAPPARFDAADVPRLLAADLRARSSPRHDRLVELRRLTLPYWVAAKGALVAGFATPIASARKLAALAGESSPARLAERPALPSDTAKGASALALVPAFGVRYEVRGRVFHAIVDAASGAVLADLHPSPWTVRVHLAMALVLAVDVAAFAVVASLAPNNLIRPVVVVLVGLPVYAFTAFAYRLRERRRR